MAISVGDKLPDTKLFYMADDGPAEMQTSELFSGKKVVLFAVPGAFTPTCHMNHLPGYLENAAALKAKGVDEIAVVSVNDVFVMDAWKKATKGDGKITYLADGSGTFAKAIGMDLDLDGFGLGLRSKRYAMVVDDGKVATLNIEDVPSSATVSSAESILEAL